MKKKIIAKKENLSAIKNEPVDKNAARKGYNEKNPGQPQGAFKPDAIDKRGKK